MADRKISDLTALTTPASGDYLPIVDISEASAANKNKRITIEELLRGAPDGTAGAPGFAFESDPDSGLYSTGANGVALSTGGTGRLFITSAGLVGIGTSSPQASARLHVYATGDYTDESAPFTVGDSTTGGMRLFFGINNTSNYGYIGSVESGTAYRSLVLQPGGGSVGIGTTSPSLGSLVVSNDAGNVANIFLNPNSGTTESNIGFSRVGNFNASSTYIAANGDSTGYLRVITGGQERARIDSSGRLLVGTSTSASIYGIESALQLYGTTYPTSSISLFRDSSTSAEDAAGILLARSRTGKTSVASGDRIGFIAFNGFTGTTANTPAAEITAWVDGTPGANDMPTRLVFSTTADGASSPTERMRISNGGSIILGSGSPSANTTITVYPNDSNGAALADWNRADTASTSTVLRFRNNAVTVGSVSYTNTATSYNTSSDYRLKENVAPVTDGITRLQQLKPSRFNFIADPDKTVDGFLAHEVQTIVPEAITGEKDAVDDDGNPIYQGIDQSKLVPLLTAALQEAVAKIESLEAKVAALENA